VDRILGQGGSAVVCLAQDLRHSRPVAIKVLRPEISMLIGRERFLDEIETVAKLQHPLILPLYDSGEADGLLYFVMPYVQGDSLRDRLEREKQLPVEDALAITRDVATALAFAHERGVVHRDIKPENVMLFGGSAVVADFGIARVLHVAGDSRKTDAGLALGTPLYMSPEQTAASGDIDARSDQYSLACVLYEMLGGTPPFTGVSPADVLAHHVHARPRPISELRSTVPPALTLAVSKALSKLPADRFRSITEFADAILAAPRGRAKADTSAARWRVWAAGVVLVIAAAAGVTALVKGGGPPLDPERYVVLPVSLASQPQDSGLDAAQIEQELYSAISRWDDVHFDGHTRTHDAWSRVRPDRASIEKGFATARALGAGLLLWTEADVLRDSVVVRGSLYNTAHRFPPVRDFEVHVPHYPKSPADVSLRLRRLVDHLVLGSDVVPDTGRLAEAGTQKLAAWREFGAGFEALGHWQLDSASRHFGEAATLDPDYALAHLWGAQVGAWADWPSRTWRASAFNAVLHQGRFTNFRDSIQANALLALADSQYPESCALYKRLVARDSTDAVAWFGLGDCLSRDRAVIPDRASPSGWRFRSGYQTALNDYRRALDLSPSLHLVAIGARAYGRITRMLPLDPSTFRTGHAELPDTGTFVAFAALDADTFAYVPRRTREGLLMGSKPTTHDDAVERGRSIVLNVDGRWVDAMPASAQAHAALGAGLESQGLLDASGGRSALAEFRTARRYAANDAEKVKMGVAVVRVLLKLGHPQDARVVADSVLAGPSGPDVAEDVAGIAMLLGRTDRAAALLASTANDSSFMTPGGAPMSLPRPLGESALRFFAYAAAGAPEDSVRSTRARVDSLLVRWVSRSRRDSVRHALMDDGEMFAFAALGITPAQDRRRGNYLLELQYLIGHGDSAEARRQLEAIEQRRASARRGGFFPIAAYHEALLWLAMRDPARAASSLDRCLEELPAGPTLLLDGVEHTSALVRAMALRSKLAARSGDVARARRWASWVSALWSDGDPRNQLIVDSLRRM
jgi:serine/threonine protein kinase/tetratricopeptide (TPR) repeat protein